jgi:glycosyltransferase involved in cell wall biosynthesis
MSSQFLKQKVEKVSVVIPSYNYGQFIGAAIESVLAQSYPIAEIIVIDDGSTDKTEQIVKKFDNKVHYIKQKNSGVCAARNNGVKISRGDFIAFLDADDSWHPQKIEKQMNKFQSDSEIGLVHCGMREFDSETNKTIRLHLEGSEGWVAKDILLFDKNVIIGPGGAIVIKREAFEEVKGFDTNLKIGEDWDFCYRVARKFKIGFVPEILVNYRNHGKNTHLNVKEMERSTLIAWNKAFDTKDKEITSLRRESFGNLHKVLAGSYLYSGQYLDFLRNLLLSLWFKPSYLSYYLSLLLQRRKKSS